MRKTNMNGIKKINEYKPAIKKMIKLTDDSGINIDFGSTFLFILLENQKKKPESIVNKVGIDNEKRLSENSIQPNLNRLPSKTQTQLPNTTKIISDFKSLIDQMIETIVNLETSAINYSNLDKNMKILLNPANYENVPVPEIVEKDIGKYLYTIVNLMEVLENAYEKSNVKLTLSNVKKLTLRQLLNILDERI